MKRLFFFLILLGLGIAFQSCGDSEGGGNSAMDGIWRLSQITVNLDGSQLTQFSVSGLQTTFSSDSFSYNDGGSRSGAWEINEDETQFTANFENKNLTFPIISKTETEITLEIKTVDLNAPLDNEARGLITVANQKLTESGNSWREASTGAQSATFLFTLTK